MLTERCSRTYSTIMEGCESIAVLLHIFSLRQHIFLISPITFVCQSTQCSRILVKSQKNCCCRMISWVTMINVRIITDDCVKLISDCVSCTHTNLEGHKREWWIKIKKSHSQTLPSEFRVRLWQTLDSPLLHLMLVHTEDDRPAASANRIRKRIEQLYFFISTFRWT